MIFRPCGACAAMVTVLGCEHWQPKPDQLVQVHVPAQERPRRGVRSRHERRARAQAAEAVAEFRRTTAQ